MLQLKFKDKDKEILLKRPDFLVGNGINYLSEKENIEEFTKELSLSWTEILYNCIPDGIKKQNMISNIDDLKGLNYPEIAEYANLISNISIKQAICNKLVEIDNKRGKNKELYKNHENLITLAKGVNCPVLTTNYDQLLLKPLNLISTKLGKYKNKEIAEIFRVDEKGEMITTNRGTIPSTNIYYRGLPFEKDSNVTENFAVWPIHGSLRFPGSICITNVDYSYNTTRIHKSIKNRDKSLKKESDLPGKDDWVGKYEWPNIFYSNDLIIVGLGLESQETDLRSFLVERYNYKKKHGLDFKTLYLYRSEKESEELPKGKELFFNQIGIQCIGLGENKMYDFENYLKIVNQ